MRDQAPRFERAFTLEPHEMITGMAVVSGEQPCQMTSRSVTVRGHVAPWVDSGSLPRRAITRVIS